MSSKPPPNLTTMPFMTPWYGPKALAQTGLRAFTSGIVLGQIDQRILQASFDTCDVDKLVSRYDYSDPTRLGLVDSAPVWVDYMADTGDGFESTFSVASLLSAPELAVNGLEEPLPAGQLLFMGGDQAYPFSSDDEYDRRLVKVFNMASWNATPAAPDKARKLFALPGNHDWYDGLGSFERLFCTRRDGVSKSGRRIGAWECQQHRSYWAVRLPYGWWFWGLDVQLDQSLDFGQIQYFHAVAQHMKAIREDELKRDPQAPEPKLIMCIPSPSWYAGHQAADTTAYSLNLQRIFNLGIDCGKVCAVLTGDLHHYSRYFSPDHRVNLFTAGGGGAYLAPTHDVPSKLNVPWQTTRGAAPVMLPFTLNGPTSTDDEAVKNAKNETRREAVYPSKRASRWLSYQILLFPIMNPTFCLALGALYFLMWWFYTSAQIPLPTGLSPATTDTAGAVVAVTEGLNKTLPSLREQIIVGDLISGRWLGWVNQILLPITVARWNPAFAVTTLAIFGMIWSFLAGSKRPAVRLAESLIFWLCHVYAMAVLAQVILSFADPFIGNRLGDSWRVIGNSSLMFFLASGVAGTMCGIYLFLGNRVFMTHLDNGFSACRIAGYKNFLRMRITRDELTIYPIGLRRVPKSRFGWRPATPEDAAKGSLAAYVAREPLEPRIIEGPIVIRPSDIVNLQ